MIDVRIHDNIREIIINRPEKRNALTPAMLDAITDAAASADEHVILLRGNGPRFCAGFDLSMCRDDDTILPALLTKLSAAIRALRRAPGPVVIAAHGAAIAGGCAILGGGDFVITDANAKLGYPVVTLGISPAVSAPSLRGATSGESARELLLHPKLVDGAAAARMGLVAECLPTPEDVEQRARELAESIAAKPPGSVSRTKAWLNEIDMSDRDDAFDQALQASLDLVGSEEQRELLAQIWQS